MLKRGVGGTGKRQAHKRFFEFFDKDGIDETLEEHEVERSTESMIVEFDEFNKYTRSVRMELYVSFAFWDKHLRGMKGQTLLHELTVLAYLAEAHLKRKFDAYNKQALQKWLRADAANMERKKRMNNASIKNTLRSLKEAERLLGEKKDDLAASCNRLEALTQNLSSSELSCLSSPIEGDTSNPVEQTVAALVDKVVLLHLDEARSAVVNELNSFQLQKKVFEDTQSFADKLQVQSVVENLVDTVSSYHVRQWFDQHSHSTLASIYHSAPLSKAHDSDVRDLQYPLYLIATRDCFSCLVIGLREGTDFAQFDAHSYDFAEPILTLQGTDKPQCINWYFHKCYGIPPAYHSHYGQQEGVLRLKDDTKLFPVGVKTYVNAFNESDVRTIEEETMGVYYLLGKNSQFRDNTADHTVRASRCVRTKMFFEYRYLWSSQQLKAKVSSSLWLSALR